jgi:DNA primase
MSRRIPQSFIDDLVARADIVDVVGGRVTLRKAGRDYKANCPFHDEKTPSFTVSPTKGFYHCFGCGAHGTALGFLMSYENLSFPEAVEALAEKLGLEIPSVDDHEERDQQSTHYDLLKEAEQIYRHALRDSTTAVEYLKGRVIEGTTAARFAIGYAPDAWDTLLSALGTTAERVDALLAAGLVVKGERGRNYDRFRNRIMFPIRDPRGRVIGFGGRLIGAGEPKYLNSPETPIFHKSQALYGLYETRQQRGRCEEILVVEGYLDVASLAQNAIEPVVATLGTATTADHVRRLTRIADRVVFCFDGDRAGRAAAWRALETALPYAGGQMQLKFLLLPEGEDPDSFVRQRGPEQFRALLEEALPLSDFMLRELTQATDLGSVDGRAELAARAGPLLARMPEGIYRELCTNRLAEVVGLPVERFAALIQAAPRPPGPAPDGQGGGPAAAQRPTLIRKALALILNFPPAAAETVLPEGWEEVAQPGAALLRRLLETTQGSPEITTAGLLERFRDDPEGRYLGRIAGLPVLDEAESAAAVLADSLGRIVADFRRERLTSLLGRWGELSPGEQDQAREEARRLSHLAQKGAPRGSG